MITMKKLSIITLALIANFSIISASSTNFTVNDAFNIIRQENSSSALLRQPKYNIDLSSWEVINPVQLDTSCSSFFRVNTNARFVQTHNPEAEFQQFAHDFQRTTRATQHATNQAYEGIKNTGYYGYQTVNNGFRFAYNTGLTGYQLGASAAYGLAAIYHLGANTVKRCRLFR